MTTIRGFGLNSGDKVSEGEKSARIAEQLLGWYDRARRDLPWRMPPGELADPYLVWLSEIMLQQTTVKAVAPYYARFLARWPDVEALAATDLDDVLKEWAGLGYYARARNLHACAITVANEYGGRFPDTEPALLELPGIGPYTAAAIAAIAFDRRAAVVDGNVERVLSRLYAIETPLPESKPELRSIAETLAPKSRPGDYAQAMMDLGATLCSPRSPSCLLCPLIDVCDAHACGLQNELPRKAAKAEKPTRRGAAFFARRKDGSVLLRRREEKGLLGGMAEVPGTPWHDKNFRLGDDVLSHAPLAARWTRLPGSVRHTFTHFHLELDVYRATKIEPAQSGKADGLQNCMWIEAENLDGQALPSLMRKVIAHAMDHESA